MTPAVQSSRFGRYEIIRKLGRSMMDVYLALDPDANRRVVLKVVEHSRDNYTQLVVDAERRGAMIQHQLHSQDPRILEVYEYGDLDGWFFVAMEYAEGQSLADLIHKQGRLDPLRVARIGIEICSQLQTLHSFQTDIDGQKRAVVHGDIKPSNVQIGTEGSVSLLDFGIAKAITATRNLTRHNLGTPAYCSPERLKNGNVDPFSDLWAVGVCLYEMIAGLPPYAADTTRKLEALIESRRPPRALPDSCPPSLRAIVLRAISADPGKRYPSAEALEGELRAFVDGRRIEAEVQRAPSWDANATVEGATPFRLLQPTTETPRRSWPALRKFWNEERSVVWSLVAGLAIGPIVFFPASRLNRYWSETAPFRAQRDYRAAALADIDKDWSLLQDLQRRYAYLGRFAPVPYFGGSVSSKLAGAGDQVLKSFELSAEPGIDQYDWERARLCFERLASTGDDRGEWKAKLATATGFVRLAKKPAQTREATASFRQAVALAPRLISPHLGLAWIYVYDLHNPGSSLAEFQAAENVGHRVGPREKEQQADVYLFRAEAELKNWNRAAAPRDRTRLAGAAQRDLDRARTLYEPIAGYSKVSDSLDRLEKDEQQLRDNAAAREHAAKVTHRNSRYRRWR